MITLKNVRDLNGALIERDVPHPSTQVIDGEGRLILLPALVACNASFVTPGQKIVEDWSTGAECCLKGGITTAIATPSHLSSCTTHAQMKAKTEMVAEELKRSNLLLRTRYFLEATPDHLLEIGKSKDLAVGIQLNLGSPDFSSVVNHAKSIDRLFQIAAQENLIVSVNIYDDPIYPNESLVIKETERAIDLTLNYNGQLLLNQVSYKEQLNLIKKAKEFENLVYSSTTPTILKGLNASLLWSAIRDGSIDIICNDNKGADFFGIKTFFPFLLTAWQEGLITLSDLINVARLNPHNIFNLEQKNDFVLIDPKKHKEFQDPDTKVTNIYRGWPVFTYTENGLITC